VDSKPNKSEIDPAWLAYGPEKEAWKAAGNYFTAEELKRLEKESREVAITFCPEKICCAD
jgi:hypothetical protein